MTETHKISTTNKEQSTANLFILAKKYGLQILRLIHPLPVEIEASEAAAIRSKQVEILNATYELSALQKEYDLLLQRNSIPRHQSGLELNQIKEHIRQQRKRLNLPSDE